MTRRASARVGSLPVRQLWSPLLLCRCALWLQQALRVGRATVRMRSRECDFAATAYAWETKRRERELAQLAACKTLAIYTIYMIYR